MSIDYLENIEEKEELIKSNLTCMIYLRDAYKVQLKKRLGLNEITSLCNYKRRKYTQSILVYTWNRETAECVLEWIKNGNEVHSTNVFTWRSMNSSIILNDGRILCTGYFSPVHKDWYPSIFDGKINQWYTLYNFNFLENNNRPMLNLVELNNLIYVLSHQGNFGCYNIKEKKWLDLEPIDKKFYSYDGLVVSNGFIYNISYCNVLQYNLCTKQWTEISQQGHNSGKCSAVCSLNGLMYVMGGEKKKDENLKSAMVFNPSTKIWSNIADMKVARSSTGAVAINGLVYAIGGEKCDSYEIYDPKTQKWTLSKYTLRTKKHISVRAFSLNPDINLNLENISKYYSI